MQLGTDFSRQCKEQSEVMVHINEEAMTLHMSRNATRDNTAVPSDNACTSHSSTTLGVDMAVVKREQEPTDCTIS